MDILRSLQVPSTKKPIVARYFCCALLGLLLASRVNAQGAAPPAPLTERDVVMRVLQRAPLADVIDGEVATEEGRGRAASAYPNPQLSYTREQTFGTFGTGEDYLSLAQTLDLGNRRGLHSQAGEARSRAAQQEGDASRLAMAANARRRFYEVLYRQGRLVALEGWLTRIDQTLAIVTRREQRGDAATYDLRRLERERAFARGRLETERAKLERALARLQAMLGPSPDAPRVTGTLPPDAEPTELAALRASARARPDLVALDLRVEAASLDRAAAARWWVPDLRLEGGWKGVDLGSQGRTDGFVLGASLSIPLWDQSAGLARIAEGETQAASGRRALSEAELEGELAGARAEAVRLRRAAVEFRAQTLAVSGDLVRIASAGYEGGELGLLELLDAYRGAADDSLGALDLEHSARRARIELDRLTGAGLP